jgi:hypothetical protein
MVAGGIGLNPNGQTVPLNSAETFTLSPTLPTGSWFQEAVLPDRLTGSNHYPEPDSANQQLVPGSHSTPDHQITGSPENSSKTAAGSRKPFYPTDSKVAPSTINLSLPTGNWFQEAVLPDRLTGSTLYP